MEEQIKYFAGLFDADGSIAVYKSNTSYSTKFQLSGVHRPMIESAYDFFGVGKFTTQKRNGPSITPKGPIIGKQGWIWRVNSKAEVAMVLRQITPYLIEKREQAETVLQFIDKSISGDEVVEKCKSLKQHEFKIGDDFEPVVLNRNDLDPYFAGLFDGDGSAGLYSGSAKILICGTYKPMISVVRDYFNYGSLGPQSRQVLREEDGVKVLNKQMWRFAISAKEELKDFLERIYPYLNEKKDQAGIILRYLNGEVGYTRSSELCKKAKQFEFVADGFGEYIPRRTGGLAGGANPAAKLGDKTWAEIFRRYNEGEKSVLLSEEFGVHRTHIPRIIKRMKQSCALTG